MVSQTATFEPSAVPLLPAKQEAGDDEDEGAAAAEGGGAVKAPAPFTGWPFQDDDDYETSDSDEFSDGDEELGQDEPATARETEGASAGGPSEELAERRRAMPPMENMGREPGGGEGKCCVALCVCLEGHMRVRTLLSLVHTIAREESSCLLANASWDATVPEAATPASGALPGDGSIADDAAAVQLPAHCVHALLMHGASPDHCGRDGQSALEAAVMCRNAVAVAALCEHGADASAYSSQEALNGVALAADAKDSRIPKIQDILKQHSVAGRGSAFEAAQAKSRAAWLRLAARICWVHHPQAPPVPRHRDAASAPDAALVMPAVQSLLNQPLKPAADFSRLKFWRLSCCELGDVLACLQRACALPFVYDESGCALRFMSASGAVVLSDKHLKSAFRLELVQAVVKDVPLCITSNSAAALSEVIAASNAVSAQLLDHIKSGMISCNPQLASLLLPVTFNAKSAPPPTPWERVLRKIIDSAADGSNGEQQQHLPGRCFRSCVSFTMLIVASCPAVSKALEPKNAAVAVECVA